MASLELNRKAIESSINSIDKLNPDSCSINDIELLLTPLFTGYMVKAPSFDPGIYLYRSRIVSEKPEYLHELTYPPAKYVTDYGRANDIGQSMFYGSISRNVPYFEMGATAGDKLVMSVWKTNSKLLLNHIGFTETIFKMLRSNRNLDSIYPFVKGMHNFNDLNELAYNYLAAAFSRKISKDEKYLYKVSVAISKKLLMGDLIPGILYPTIAMSGNSDNIVLKPSYVDEHLEFIAVEYIEVTEAVDMKYHSRPLDAANEIVGKKIQWSGKSLGWTLENQQAVAFRSDGVEWIGEKNGGNRWDLKPTHPIRFDLSALEQKFLNDFKDAVRIGSNIMLKSSEECITVKVALLLNFDTKSRFLAYYIPASKIQSGL